MSPAALVISFVLLAGGLFIAGVVSALETALFCLKEHHVVSLAERQPQLKGIIRAIARRPRRSIHQALFLSSVMNLSLAILALLLLRESGPVIPGKPVLSALILFGGIVIFGDLIPTLAALSDPGLVFRAAVKPFIVASPVISRTSAFFERISDGLGSRLVPSSAKPARSFTDEEFETLIEMRRDDGTLLPSESKIIQEIVRLGNKTVKDCMTPRVDALLAPDSLDQSEMIGHLEAHGDWHWKVPVYGDSPDVVTGILDVRRWLRFPDRDFRESVGAPVFVPETMMVLDVFRDYLSRPRSLAVVLDEYGGVEGVISHADIIEEILENAAPAPDQEVEIRVLGNGKIEALGDARLDEIGEELGIDLEQEGLDTIGGLIFNERGGVPAEGEEILLPGILVKVIRCEGQRITKVEIEREGIPTTGERVE